MPLSTQLDITKIVTTTLVAIEPTNLIQTTVGTISTSLGTSVSQTVFTTVGVGGLMGDKGDRGLSAYEVWLGEGNVGTEQDFLDSLVSTVPGPTGAPGPAGTTDYNLLLNTPTIPTTLAALADDAAHRLVTDTHLAKLDSVATGATANSNDSTLLDRANHTGTQSQSTIANLVTDLSSKQPLSAVLTNTTAAFTTTQETKLAGIAAGAEVNVNADWNAVSGDAQILNKPTIPDQLSDLSDDNTHRLVTDVEKATWNAKQAALGFTPVPDTRTVAGKPLTSDVSLVKDDVGLGNVDNTSDANKPVSGPQQTALDAKAPTAHSHTISGVTGLQTALEGKLSEAPIDGKQYARKDGAWVEVVGGTGGTSMATFDTTLDFGDNKRLVSSAIVYPQMTDTMIVQCFYQSNMEEAVLLDMRVAESSRLAGTGFNVTGVAPSGASGIYNVRCIVSGT